MQTRQSGRHNLFLPMLGIGCWQFGGGNYWGPTDQTAVDAVVRHAVAHGCNYFDTAESYNDGASETALAQALRGIARDKVIIGSKVSPSNTAPQTIVEHCEASLRLLATDYIDLYMVHWPITPHSIAHFAPEQKFIPSPAEAFATLRALQKAGKIRHIGVSNFGPQILDETLATGTDIVINELPYSLLTRAIEVEILPHCREKGVGVLGYLSLMQGVLAGIYKSLDDVPPYQRRSRHFDSRRSPHARHHQHGVESETAAALSAIGAIAKKQGLSMPEIALKWAIAAPGITCTLVGVRSVAKLRANIEAVAKPLDPQIINELNAATQPLLKAMGPSFDLYEHPNNDRTKHIRQNV